MSSEIHSRMLELAKEMFETEGFRVITTEKISPDLVIFEEHKCYAVEILTKPRKKTVWEKIDKYLDEDFDGLYFIVPYGNAFDVDDFSHKKVTFITFPQFVDLITEEKEKDVSKKIDQEFCGVL